MTDGKKFIKDGHEHIRALISAAVADGSRRAIVRGAYEIAEAVKIPSDFELVLEDCHLRMADGVYDNMFVNEHHGTELGMSEAGRDHGISIIGRGEAILDGGNYNGLSERNHSRDGMPPIWKNNLILLTNAEDIRITGIACHNQRWWAICFIACARGYLSDIDFRSSDIGIDSEGREYHGLKRAKYDEVLVKNSDGIDLRAGCHDFVIENITGFTEDDTVALTGLVGALELALMPRWAAPDIHHVTIKNVRSAAFCTNVRLLNQGDVSLHDITIDGVYDTSDTLPYLDHGLYTVRIGDTRMYGTRHATADETYNITVKNVRGGGDYVISLAGEIGNLVLENIEAIGDTELMLDNRNGKTS